MDVLTKKIKAFESWYDEKLSVHEQSVGFYCNLLSSIPFVESVRGRVKSKDECISKFKRKYLPEIKADEEDYSIAFYISDLIGIRAICFYMEEVIQIRRGLKKYFIETEISDKTKVLEKTDDKFGYRSLHLQLTLRKSYQHIPDAQKFSNIIIELQIRTVIQDAWSILDHKIKYKKSIPQNLKRRINRLSALFEIAEDEFSSVKKQIEKEERKINARLKKGRRIESDKPLDVFRFLFVTLKYFPGYNFIEFKVDGFVQEILQQKDTFTEGELDSALKNNLELAESIEERFKQKLNPYTKIRYCLFRANEADFKHILSIYQKKNLEKVLPLSN